MAGIKMILSMVNFFLLMYVSVLIILHLIFDGFSLHLLSACLNLNCLGWIQEDSSYAYLYVHSCFSFYCVPNMEKLFELNRL